MQQSCTYHIRTICPAAARSQRIEQDENLQAQAKVNQMDTFKYAFDDKFIDKLIARMDQNQEIFEKILEDKAFGDLVKELMMARIYRRLNE